ncbi:MAG: FAD-dependent oxidoreductase [Bacteroidetes bacterium]|jgi:isorenieratene synthase|nr:FAD-dependent oxidoreductase [Bacteroidota bacterium]
MRAYLRRKIKAKLQNYRVALNKPDENLPTRLSKIKSVAILGGGIAGISATANLSERGFNTVLFEKSDYLGGKVGSWTFESNGETLRAEHGFHAFFRQYYNLREFMKKIDSFKHLIPIDDYVIMFGEQETQGFKGLDNTPGLNVLGMRKQGIFNWFTFVNPFSIPFLNLLSFNPKNTFKKLDNVDFKKFAKRTMMPKKMQMVFNSFARAFFSAPEKMSMAELIKGFHFYFLSNEDGLLYDVLNNDFQHTFLNPCIEFITKNGGLIKMNTAVESIEKKEDGFLVNGQMFDYVVWCIDVKHSQPLIQNSTTLKNYGTFYTQMTSLKCSDRYAVYRIWTDKFETQKVPFFVFTDRLKCLDSITFYHNMEIESGDWSKKNNGGIFELHCYALPDDLKEDTDIKIHLLKEMIHFFPELEGFNIKHEFFQHRHDFPAFHVGLHKDRPTIKTEVPGLFLAGDWVKMDNSTMLMEAAYTSGALAANEIFKLEQLRENQLESVAMKGIFG